MGLGGEEEGGGERKWRKLKGGGWKNLSAQRQNLISPFFFTFACVDLCKESKTQTQTHRGANRLVGRCGPTQPCSPFESITFILEISARIAPTTSLIFFLYDLRAGPASWRSESAFSLCGKKCGVSSVAEGIVSERQEAKAAFNI